jgi:outer membrane protein assembly factor BamE (lipoprotein component of BamABCDE complex)
MRYYAALVAVLLCAGCASQHAADVQKGLEGDRLTLGKVQREIHIGMPNSQVVEVLGSPNIVTTDEARREVWVYDKFATDVVASSGGVWLILGVVEKGAASSSQRTMTVVVKFDEQQKVRDFAYHTSRF